jgi:hypothetical protein
LGIGGTRMSAILRAMFPDREQGERVTAVAPADVTKFLRDHPTFSTTTIYPRKEKVASATNKS